MKQKFNITVADMQLSIVSDANPEEVEAIVGMLDRKMRDINLKSPRCTKNEAAILCALSYCSERLAAQETAKKLEKDCFRFATENERLKKQVESLKIELNGVREDNAVMRSVLSRTTNIPTPQEAPAKKQAAPATSSVSAEQLSVEIPAAAESGTPVVEESEEKSEKGKSRVGTMFDLLTFSDV
ncbi:MAG: cell division protein ZapA [Ruminococcaceae bacterium]|nr:cell division protein ZapA [Oscillospiraceae bacterium]